MMASKIKAVLVLILVGALTACAPTTSKEPATTPDLEADAQAKQQIMAVINGETVKRGEYKQELDSAYKRFHNAGQLIDGSMYQQLQTEVRESLINLILLDQYSQKLGIVVDEATVDKYLKAAVDRYESKQAYEKSMAEAGMTEADIRQRLKRTLSAQEVVRTQLHPKAEVTDEEVRAYYDGHPFEFEHDIQVHAAHILIKVHSLAKEETKKEARKRIMEIKAKIDAGADFAEMAKQYSEGPSKANGGDLGFFGSAQMAPAFETAAFSLQPGEVSDVVTTQYGFHLIKAYERKPAGKETYEEAAPYLKERFQKERLNQALQQLVEKLKAEATIERYGLASDKLK